MIPLTRRLPCARGWRGRPAKDRYALASAFVAKAVHGFETTRQLLDRLRVDRQLRLLCGWSSVRELPQRLHEALVLETQKDRLVRHISRDSPPSLALSDPPGRISPPFVRFFTSRPQELKTFYPAWNQKLRSQAGGSL